MLTSTAGLQTRVRVGCCGMKTFVRYSRARKLNAALRQHVQYEYFAVRRSGTMSRSGLIHAPTAGSSVKSRIFRDWHNHAYLARRMAMVRAHYIDQVNNVDAEPACLLTRLNDSPETPPVSALCTHPSLRDRFVTRVLDRVEYLAAGREATVEFLLEFFVQSPICNQIGYRLKQ